MKKSLVTDIYICAMFSLFLFYTGFRGYSGIFTAKKELFTILSLTYIGVSALWGIPFKKFKLPEISALAYFIITAVSAVLSDYFPKTLLGVSRYEGLLTIGIYVFVFIFVSRDFEMRPLFIPFLSVVMIAESIIVILQLFDFNVMGLYPIGENLSIATEKYNGVFISTIGNADIASAFFSLLTPVLFVLFLRYEKYKPMTFMSFVLSLICVLSMSVSAGIVAMLSTAVILPFVLFPKRRKLILLLLCIALIISLLLIYFLPFRDGMLYEFQCIMKGEADRTFGAGRFHRWSEVISNTKPLFGSGPDTMLYEDIEPFVKIENGEKIVRRIDIAHNDYLNILFHQGIFALISYFCLLSPLLTWFKNKKGNAFPLAVGAGAFAYSVQVFFSFSACSSAIFFWIMLGILNAEQKRYE